MNIQKAAHTVLKQLSGSLISLTNEQYCVKIDTLSDGTIGQHVRHVIEMFVCLHYGYITSTVNYEKRQRDITIETSKELAIQLIERICDDLFPADKKLTLEVNLDENKRRSRAIPTNYYREIVYNIEHTIHHMALIKIGINQVSDVVLPEEYGVAASTLKYKKESIRA
ncbi:MAG: hypothetical protein ABI402_12100 [Ferruginibacter sp.]